MIEKNPAIDNCLQGMAAVTAAVTKICERTAQLNAATMHAFSEKNKAVLESIHETRSPEEMLRLPMQMANEYNQVFFQHCQQALDNFAEICKVTQENFMNHTPGHDYSGKVSDQKAQVQPQAQKQTAKGSTEKAG